jgi:hypothetical protein
VAGEKYLYSMNLFVGSTSGDKPLHRPAPPLRFSGVGLKSPSLVIALGFLLFECGEVNKFGGRRLGLASWRQSVNESASSACLLYSLYYGSLHYCSLNCTSNMLYCEKNACTLCSKEISTGNTILAAAVCISIVYLANAFMILAD